MYTKNTLILQLISLLKQYNIRHIVVSPGSRHFSLVHSLENDSFFKLYSVVDERSAAFFALGLIQKLNEPVAITCSSGTACMNYGSAIVEAFYQHLPLLVLSSDRNPQLLNQLEDQFYNQISTFKDCTKYQGQLCIEKDAADNWYNNRIINEALIELDHHGKGPVHLNFPIISHCDDTFNTLSLPLARKIDLHTFLSPNDWMQISQRLKGKKVMIIWGQSVYTDDSLYEDINEFTQNFDAVILTDHISNCKANDSIKNVPSVLSLLTSNERKILFPDIVITLGGNYVFNNEIKGYLKSGKFEHWQVGQEDKVCDPFTHLKDLFEMPERVFFKSINDSADFQNQGEYRLLWKNLSQLPPLPTPDYNELYVIGKFLSNIPNDADLQLANSCTIRMAHFFPIAPSITVHCNRGVNGIDGSMSTAVGFSATNDRPTFYVTGDLSFFYDMNSLWIKHISKKMRILLINNGGGAIMYGPLSPEIRLSLPPHIAACHQTTAKGWVESLGYTYISASDKVEFDDNISFFCNSDIDTPIVFEVFTKEINNDINSLNDYYKSLNREPFVKPSLITRVINKAKRITQSYIRK